MSFHVGAIIVFTMLAPIRKARPKEKEWPISRRLSVMALIAFLLDNTSFMYLISAFMMPIKMTNIANI